jgi:UDP-N-acetylmuramyl pentapeptide phosphotransferase/UDP-N-acetylglucosamine-1-phosphate transferase
VTSSPPPARAPAQSRAQSRTQSRAQTRAQTRAQASASASAASLVTAAATSWTLLRAGRRLPPRLREPWERTNHAGASVTLLEGPAWVGGAVAGAAAGAATGALASRRAEGSGRPALATTVVALAAGALGALDDLAGGTADKGLKGHLTALARGEVTTGALKIVGLGATGLVGAMVIDSGTLHACRQGGSRAVGVLSTLVGGAVVAGAANAVNLFDLRPGRALKVTVAAGLPMVGAAGGLGVAAGAAVGSSLGVVRDDLAAGSMLGDTGANAAGALVGLALVERTGLVGRAVALTALAALTLASERVSFTKVIEANPALRRLDEWGRGRR